MRTAYLTYTYLLDERKKVRIGGIETYISDLSDLLLANGWNVYIYQYASESFAVRRNGYEIIGVPKARNSRDLIDAIEKSHPDYENDLLIFASDFMIVKNNFRHSIALQHGIAWDITSDSKVADFWNYCAILGNAMRTIVKYNRYKNVSCLVCVDYNFINWYRTQVAHVDIQLSVIPNYTKIGDRFSRPDKENVSVIFARRLVGYRGTRLFAEAIIPLFRKYGNLSVTIAGAGPDEGWLKEKLSGLDVTFTSFNAGESLNVHRQFDIAVIPTKGSEGTSLSLLEAMSAGCAVVVTNIGGMTNVVLNGYNGLMVSPDVTELREAIERLVCDKDLRGYLAANAYETVRASFSHEVWKKRWTEFVNRLYQ